MRRLSAVVVLLLFAPAGGAGCLFGGGGAVAPDPGPIAHMNADGVKRLEAGDDRGAEEAFRRALAQAELTDDLGGQAESWNNLGALARERGAPAEALALHKKALALHRAAGGGEGEARTRNNMGAALLALGRLAESRAEFEQAAKLYGSLERPAGVARAKVGVAAVMLREGKDPRGALAVAREAEGAARTADDRATLAAALANEGGALEATGDLAGARAAYEAALAIDKTREAPLATADDLHSLGRICEKAKSPGEAAGLYARASRVQRRVGDLAGAERDLDRAVQLARRANLADQAGECQAELDALRAERAKQQRQPGGATAPTSSPAK